MKVLVLGGNGFIGNNIVAQLKRKNIEVLVGSRKAGNASVRQIQLQYMLDEADWFAELQGVDVVVNSVGILRERRRENYNQIHALAPEALANACARLGVKLIHISAIGLSEQAKSGFIRSKYFGELAILASGADAIVVRADRKSTRLNSSHPSISRMPSSA